MLRALSEFKFGKLLAITVLALSFVAGQAISQQHLHSADEPVEHCLICGHLDHTPAAGQPDLTVASVAAEAQQADLITQGIIPRILRSYAPRAPPLS